jgi:hypothetical protein
MFDMMGVDHQQSKLVFQKVVDGLPILARTFHSDVGDPTCLEPVGEFQEIAGHSCKSLGVVDCVALLILTCDIGGDHGFLVNV